MRVVRNSMITSIVIGVAVAALAVASPADAAPPTRVVDHTRDVFCTAVSGDLELTVRAEQSDLAGTASFAQLSTSTGEFVAYGSADSGWTDNNVRASIPVLDRDGRELGEVYLAAAFAPAGEPNVITNRFNDGNIHVVETHSETPLAISDVVLTYGDITFTDVRCDGGLVDGSLFFTNPAAYVAFSTNLIYTCETTNVSSYDIVGPLDDLFVDVEYADLQRAQAGGIVAVEEGSTWTGEFDLQIADEPAGTVGVTATLGRSGRPVHRTDGDTGMRNHAQLTPYPFSIELQGPGAPARLDCTLYDIRLIWQQPNVAG